MRGQPPEEAVGIRGRAVARLVVNGLLAAFAAMSAQGAGTVEEHPMMTKQTIAVEHVRIESTKSFADVRAALERHRASLGSHPPESSV
jgi:hypothetical protein